MVIDFDCSCGQEVLQELWATPVLPAAVRISFDLVFPTAYWETSEHNNLSCYMM
jgi:hypothetical protein